jgi:hypothetical protein
MSKAVEVELRSLKQDAVADEHVFSYARTGLKLTTFRHAWEGACQVAKISGLRFHDLRHKFATRLRAKGVHEMDIMTLLGHTTLQMTSRYTHAMPQNLRTAVDSLGETNLGRVVRFKRKSESGSSDPSATADGTDLMTRVERVSVSNRAPKSRQVATGTDGA